MKIVGLLAMFGATSAHAQIATCTNGTFTVQSDVDGAAVVVIAEIQSCQAQTPVVAGPYANECGMDLQVHSVQDYELSAHPNLAAAYPFTTTYSVDVQLPSGATLTTVEIDSLRQLARFLGEELTTLLMDESREEFEEDIAELEQLIRDEALALQRERINIRYNMGRVHLDSEL